MNNIVAGLLQTPEGSAAISAAGEAAATEGARLHLVALLGTAIPEESGALAQYRHDVEALEAELGDVATRLRTDHGIEIEEHLVQGELRPSRAILDVAVDVAADLIVIGIRRRSRVGKLVLGSNAQDILLEADAPVLCVKAADDADSGSTQPA